MLRVFPEDGPLCQVEYAEGLYPMKTCFALDGEPQVRLAIQDDRAAHVALYRDFLDPAGNVLFLPHPVFCDDKLLDVPPGATSLHVWVAGGGCEPRSPRGSTESATTGTVSLDRAP